MVQIDGDHAVVTAYGITERVPVAQLEPICDVPGIGGPCGSRLDGAGRCTIHGIPDATAHAAAVADLEALTVRVRAAAAADRLQASAEHLRAITAAADGVAIADRRLRALAVAALALRVATADEIAAAAGVGRSTLYRWADSKASS